MQRLTIASIALLVLAGLYAASLYNYLLFHSLTEIFSIVIGCGIFMMAWNTRRYLTNHYLLSIGIAYLFISILELVHTLSYAGMHTINGYGANAPTQLWIAARYMESLTLLAAPVFLRHRAPSVAYFLAYGVISAAVLLSIFHWEIFPECFIVETGGLTPFKIASEYVICLIFLASGVLMAHLRDHFDSKFLVLLLLSIGTTILAELLFTTYASVFGFSNLLGHYLKIVSIYLMYKAVIESGLTRPYDLLFKNLLGERERLRVTLASIGDGVIATDTNGKVTFLNKVAESLTGWRMPEATGEPVREVFRIADDASRMVEDDPAGAVLENASSVCSSNNSALLPKDRGGEIPVSYSGAPIVDRDGGIQGMALVFRDMTERKQTEERMRREHRETEFTNRVLRTFIEYEGDALFGHALAVVQDEMASRHGVFGYIAEPGHLICPSLSRMLDACEVEGKCIHYPADKWKGLWARALTEKRSLYSNEAPPVPPGHPIIHNNLAAPILFQGDVIGLLNIANRDSGYTEADRDLLDRIADRIAPVLYAWIQRKLREDERKAAKFKLQQLAQQRQLALDAANLGWWKFDPSTQEVQLDDSSKAIFGVGGDTRNIEQTLQQIIHPEDLPALMTKVETALDPADHQPYTTEIRINRSNGRMCWVEAHGIATFAGNGTKRRAVNFVGTVQDITDRKLAEQSLIESEKHLKQSLAEKEVLLKEIHHRVKNNMQVISSLVALQTNEVADAGMRDIFQDVVHRVRSMAIVHEKLYQADNLSKLEFGDYTQSLLSYLWNSYATESTGVKLTTKLEHVYLTINKAVPCGLILNELVSNALKHAFKGLDGGQVIVTLKKEEPDGTRLSVRDNGIGIPPDMDWRYADSLGLRLINMLSRQLHAKLEVSSDNGTEFSIAFEATKQ